MEKTKSEKEQLQSVIDEMETERAEVMQQIQELSDEHQKISSRSDSQCLTSHECS